MQVICADFTQFADGIKKVNEAMAQTTSQLDYMFKYIRRHYSNSTPYSIVSSAGYTSGGAMRSQHNENFSEEEYPLSIGSLFGVRYWTTIPATTPPVAVKMWLDEESASWKVHSPADRGLRLRGAWGPWSPGENVAECRRGGIGGGTPRHTAAQIPVRDCGCGFWVYWDPSDAVSGIQAPEVIGIVEGWGRYRGGRLGFRCAKAQVVALCVLETRNVTYSSGNMQLTTFHDNSSVVKPAGWREWAEDCLSRAYQVPIYSDPVTMMRAHPPSRGRFAATAVAHQEELRAQAKLHSAGPPASGIPVKACLVCGDAPSTEGSALCTGCEVMASLAAKNMTMVRCQCGVSHAVTAQLKGVEIVCQCGKHHKVPPPGITPAEALKQLKGRAHGWQLPLRELRKRLWENCKALAWMAADARRGFTETERLAWDRYNLSLDLIDKVLAFSIGAVASVERAAVTGEDPRA